MTTPSDFEIFLAATPGLEPVLYQEVRLKGFRQARIVPGGITIKGGWPEVWRANLWIRGSGKILARVLSFPARHLSQLERRTQTFEWNSLLPPDQPFYVETTCIRSRIYHAGAASERIARAITASTGALCTSTAEITIKARIEDDQCSISIDTSGELLHRRGSKEAINRAPLRETLASLFLTQCGYTGTESVIDPMCGSGTFVLEAAEIAARLNPGRARHFAFEKLVSFDKEAWEKMRSVKSERVPACHFYGSDRDAGAITMSQANALRAKVNNYTTFTCLPVSEVQPPQDASPGLVICNPPYGTRLGDKTELAALYRAFGNTMRARFSGWRIALITSEAALAYATALPFLPNTAPVPHGGLKISLYQTAHLP